MEIPRGKGVLKAKILEAKYEAKLESLVGGGGGTEKPFVGEVKIFSGTIHIIHVTSIQSIGGDVGRHPLRVGEYSDITMQKPVWTEEFRC